MSMYDCRKITIYFTHSEEKYKKALEFGFDDYVKHFDEDCKSWGFNNNFHKKYGVDVFAWFDRSGIALEHKKVFKWID